MPNTVPGAAADSVTHLRTRSAARAPRRSWHRPARPVIILTHTGAKTGAIRKIPIMRIPAGDSYVAVASAAGATTYPAWYFNLIAPPHVHVQDRSVHHEMTAREVYGAEKQHLWQIAETYWPHFPEYRNEAAGRDIPILLLGPTSRPHRDEPQNLK